MLQATEEVIRRFGPAKATVVDVARALKVSHGTVYRHFPSKAVLWDAVTRRLLDRVHAPLSSVMTGPGTAMQRVREWVWVLFAAQRAAALDAPELFATYQALVGANSESITAYRAQLEAQLAQIVADGQQAGEFCDAPPAVLSHALFQATAYFHDPGYASRWASDRAEADLDALLCLLLAGLAADSQSLPGKQPSNIPRGVNEVAGRG
ncbi:TetR family transcriptional regulator [Streptomyces sp. NPDC005708]|uniref:TetR family transcriptional regulator n=1 Tax=Streptomyces sp. NPDC005708 TaxID=3154564 RepID=UPI0033D34FAD